MTGAVLITGANGFVGNALAKRLCSDRFRPVSVAVRRDAPGLAEEVRVHALGQFDEDTDWGAALAGVDCVIHAAARVHVMHETASDPLAEFRRANVATTLNLASQAATAGVRRFIFISSVKVHGEMTSPGRPFRADDEPAPVDSYGLSKLEAERGLEAIAREAALQVTIIRPPLVYGASVGGNFETMMRWLQRGIPLPLASIRNSRSVVGLGNLVDFIRICIDHPAAANQVFLTSDGEDLSTPQLLRALARHLGTSARLFPMPVGLLLAAGRIVGKPGVAQRLCMSLQVDIEKNRLLLGWKPPVSVDRALHEAAAAFRRRMGNL